MAHDKFFGICENKCLVEIKPENIPGCAEVETYTATISTNWSGSSAPYTQTVEVTGITSTDTPIVDVVLDSNTNIAKIQLESWSCVSRIATGTNQILITCLEDKPTTAFTIQLKVVR